jgi:hypothetical protein
LLLDQKKVQLVVAVARDDKFQSIRRRYGAVTEIRPNAGQNSWPQPNRVNFAAITSPRQLQISSFSRLGSTIVDISSSSLDD